MSNKILDNEDSIRNNCSFLLVSLHVDHCGTANPTRSLSSRWSMKGCMRLWQQHCKTIVSAQTRSNSERLSPIQVFYVHIVLYSKDLYFCESLHRYIHIYMHWDFYTHTYINIYIYALGFLHPYVYKHIYICTGISTPIRI